MTYENAISICETKIEEKRDEADSLLTKLKELKDVQESLKIEQEASLDESLSQISGESVIQPDGSGKDGADTEAMKSVMLQKLESKKNDLSSVAEKVQELERGWAIIQERALKTSSTLHVLTRETSV